MKRLTLLTLLALTLAVPLAAQDKHQSYISYDDGGTLVRPADDDREVDARVNLPIYPGDEVVTNRRGRTEIILADGNVIALDRSTAVRFRSVLSSYEGEDDETVIELRYGKAMLYRPDDSREYFRIDSEHATFFASHEALFSVETDDEDRVVVFDGTIEVRTPDRTTRLRRGDSAEIDDRGEFEETGYGTDSADDFERWFMRRAQRYGARESRYLDRRFAYYEDDLGRYGSWVHINTYGWAWRPHVAVGWRPYYYGQWAYSRHGCLTWVSYEPWGWMPYHYGRWAYDPFYGWFWVPGVGYAPAWVYWWYGSGYIGWAPSGWWDLHRPYYDWAYRPYSRAGLGFGFGFYGRVRVNDMDLRPWTFLDANTIVSNRVDRAAITADAIRGRLTRDNDGFATIGTGAARFTREEFRDPAAAINRRMHPGFRDSGGAPADMTPFFRRDNNLPDTIRDRVVRNRPLGESGSTRTVTGGAGGVAPIGREGVAPIGGGNVAPIGGGSVAPIGGDASDRVRRGGSDRGSTTGGITRGDSGTSGRVRRDGEDRKSEKNPGAVNRSGESPSVPGNDWRTRVVRPRSDAPVSRAPESPESSEPSREDSWRDRVSRGDAPSTRSSEPPPRRDSSTRSDRGSDVPRRVIDGIGGARVRRGDDGGSSTRSRSGSSGSAPSRPPSVDRGSSGGSSHSSPPPSRDSGGSRSSDSSSSGGSRSGGEGGKIKRDQ